MSQFSFSSSASSPASSPTSRRSAKPMIVMLIAVAALVFGLGFTKFLKIKAAIEEGSKMGPPPQGVTTTQVTLGRFRSSIQVVGTVSASQGVTLSAEEDGKVAKINFESGSYVKAGDVLVEFDTSVEEAQLQSAQARLQLAQINLKRVQTLFKAAAISEQSLNNAVSEQQAADGDVKALLGVVARKRIIAPFEGRAGIRLLNLGQYVTRGTPVVPLHSMDPMFLDFSIPERYISEVKPGQKIDFSVDVYDSQKFQAEISAIDPQIDPTTRNFKVQGVVSNGDEKLRPGMFARVTFFIGSEREVVTIPASSINYAPYGNSVFVVEKMTGPNGEYAGAKQQFVTLGSSIGDLVEIVNGLSVGQEVVTSGTFKLQNGTQLIINNSVLPNANARPEVDNT